MFFPDWAACRRFAEETLTKQIVINKSQLHFHFVMEEMGPEYTEVWTCQGVDLLAVTMFQDCQDRSLLQCRAAL